MKKDTFFAACLFFVSILQRLSRCPLQLVQVNLTASIGSVLKKESVLTSMDTLVRNALI